MIFKFSICDYEGCDNWYFDVDDNLTREETIEKIYEAFRNHVKSELDEDNKRPIGEKLYCTERKGIESFGGSEKLDKEFEKVGLKKFEIPTYSIWYDEDAYALLGIDTKCREPENCQRRWCRKVCDWEKNKKKDKNIQ